MFTLCHTRLMVLNCQAYFENLVAEVKLNTLNHWTNQYLVAEQVETFHFAL